jgi:Putative prokaryotic signal transducing protein
MTSGPEQERQRLARLYSGMTSEEVENMAADGGDLTDIARETLKTEISRRALAITVNEGPTGEDVFEKRDLVLIRRFQDLPEAQLAKGSLESSGIECFLTDDNMVRMNWFASNWLGGVKLLVNRNDAETAAAILDEPTPDRLDVEDVGEYEQPKCPECHSLGRQLRTSEEEGGLHQRIARNTNSAPYSSLDLPSLWPSLAGPGFRRA